MYFSDSPIHFELTKLGWTTRKLKPASLAIALASIVFPHPGGLITHEYYFLSSFFFITVDFAQTKRL